MAEATAALQHHRSIIDGCSLQTWDTALFS